MPTRMPGGLSTASNPQGPFGELGMPDPTKYYNFYDDFDTYLATDWTITKIGTGTQALTAGDGGRLLTTNSAADDDQVSNQLTVASFLPVAGKQMFFACKFQVSDATQSDVLVGLVLGDTTPLDATDGIFFMKDDGDAQIDVYVRKDATTGNNSLANVGTLVSATDIVMAWYYDGKSTVAFFLDGVKVASLDASSSYLPDTVLAVSFSIKNGEALAKSMNMDYIFAAKER